MGCSGWAKSLPPPHTHTEQDLSIPDAEGREGEAEPRIQEKIEAPHASKGLADPYLPRTPSVNHHCVCLCLNLRGTSPHVAQRGMGNSTCPEDPPITCLTSEMSRLNTLTRISTCSHTSRSSALSPIKAMGNVSTGYCKITRVATSPTAISDVLTNIRWFRRYTQVQVHRKIVTLNPST